MESGTAPAGLSRIASIAAGYPGFQCQGHRGFLGSGVKVRSSWWSIIQPRGTRHQGWGLIRPALKPIDQAERIVQQGLHAEQKADRLAVFLDSGQFDLTEDLARVMSLRPFTNPAD